MDEVGAIAPKNTAAIADTPAIGVADMATEEVAAGNFTEPVKVEKAKIIIEKPMEE